MADKTHYFETSLKSCFFIFLKFASLIMVKKHLNTFRNSNPVFYYHNKKPPFFRITAFCFDLLSFTTITYTAVHCLQARQSAPSLGTAPLLQAVIRFGILRASFKFLWYVTGRTMFFSFPFARFLIKKEESTIRLLLSEGCAYPL